MHHKNNKEGIMKTKPLCTIGSLILMLLLAGCAGLDAKADVPLKSSVHGKRVVVFPFQDPYCKGRQIQGIGEPFASVFVHKLLTSGVSAELSKNREFSSLTSIDIDKACKYAAGNGYDMLMVGVVTEWIDGATQWSGKVDVAALFVKVYNSKTCTLSGAASGRKSGRLITFVNAPTTRFFEPLSEKVIEALLE